jgi:hypothetical protein
MPRLAPTRYGQPITRQPLRRGFTVDVRHRQYGRDLHRGWVVPRRVQRTDAAGVWELVDYDGERRETVTGDYATAELRLLQLTAELDTVGTETNRVGWPGDPDDDTDREWTGVGWPS